VTAPQREDPVQRWPTASTASTPRPARKPVSLQARVVGQLARADGPVSTSAVREALDDPASGPRVVIERVYAALVALERKRVVQRVSSESGARPLWQLRTHGPVREEKRPTAMPHSHTDAQHLIEARIARIRKPAEAHQIAKDILDVGMGQGWEKWTKLAAAPLAGWLYAASQHTVEHRVDWILRALPHRAHWSRAAKRVETDPQLCESMRSVSRLGERPFSDLNWTLFLALMPCSTYTGARAYTPTAGAR
jgi:hypothetical protein